MSKEQVASEVVSIFAALSKVESECISLRTQAAALRDGLNWNALMEHHQSLLHEYFDFFLATNHPLASPSTFPAVNPQMPTRMWKHCIFSFLELLRQRLPESMDYMLAFIYLVYQVTWTSVRTCGMRSSHLVF